jgi:hypothetical protein
MSTDVVEGGALALSPAAVGGRRRSHKKLRVVKKKTVRKMLKKMGLKMRGGAPAADPVVVKPETLVADPASKPVVAVTGGGDPYMGGRRRRHTKKTHRRSRGRRLFGMKY